MRLHNQRRSLRGFATQMIAACLIAFSWLSPTAALAAGSDERPNILIILADDLGYGDLSSFGATDLRTPAIDSLAKRGLKFDRFFANCPVCSPTRAALLTGCYPDRVGVPGVVRSFPEINWGNLADDAVLLPAVLKQAGYHTAIVGKWHLGLEKPDTPLDRGFDHFAGFLGDMMDDYYTHRRHDINYMRKGREEIDPKGHATDLFSEWAADYVKDRAGHDEPWFLYLAYNAPHTPIQPPNDWLAKVKQREPNMTDKRAKLVALIEHMDHGIGQVLKTLDETGQADNTVVIFTSDNGGQSNVGANNGATRGGKQDMYEGGIRVPFIVAWPGVVKAGSTSSEIGMSMDLFATACDIARVKMPKELDAVSMVPAFRGEGTMPQRDLYWIRREGNRRYMGQAVYAVRRGDWKLLQNRVTEEFGLFNLANDPLEQNNLANKNRQKYNELANMLMRHIQRGGQVPWQ